jgi:hypothetical protein
MADLQQIVGAILRDLAKARFGSDLYSRSIARYYENDYLLRRYSVPRADIEEVEIDLKFSVSEVEKSAVNLEGREANIAVRLERTVEELVATFLGLADAYCKRHKDVAERLEGMLAKGFKSTTVRIELRQKALRYFIESYTHLIDSRGGFDAEAALAGLKDPFRWAFEPYLKPKVSAEELKGPLGGLIDAVFADETFAGVVKSLEAPIGSIWDANFDAGLEVEIRGDKLAELGEGAISTIKIKGLVRNMVWTEVKVDERNYRRELTSE